MTLTQQVAANAERVLGLKIPNMVCPRCHGGQVPLEPHFLQVWQALDVAEARTAFEVAASTKCSVSTVKYRLMVLAASGHVRQVGMRRPSAPKRGRLSPEWVRVEVP